jgi:hypothetical protein
LFCEQYGPAATGLSKLGHAHAVRRITSTSLPLASIAAAHCDRCAVHWGGSG